MEENYSLPRFTTEFNIAFDVRDKILNSKSLAESEDIFNVNPLHPLSLYGRLDVALINKNKMIVQDSMDKVTAFIYEPFPNHFFNLPSNDPIGEIMLKPLIQYPITINSNNDPNIQDYINWMLVGYAFLFKCYTVQGIKAFDSLETMGAAIEQNSDNFAFLIFAHYLGLHNYAEAYTKFIIFTFFSSGLGFHKHGGNNNKFLKLTEEAKRYSSWLTERNPSKNLYTFFDEGQDIASDLFNKIIKDIKNKNIIIKKLKVPNF